jgi:Fic family protein
MNALEEAEQLKAELDRLRPLDSEAEARIMQKFRLDWNYHSNNLEGNSLTYGETKALILFGITAQGKPLKDHFEITGHNEAINWILEIVKGETVLTESFIRQLHTLLLKESSYKEAQTADGKPTRRKIEVGKYKTQPNHVITVTGETFYFATPEETPAKMHDLIEWFRKEKENANVNPIILAALFHYRFIRIHPFDDGNGRVARILMNFILMQFGYPPVIIKTEDKENYYAVLRLADADELEPFIEYISQNLVRSLEIMIRGAKGESIEEADDLDKELALLERRLSNIGNHIQKFKTAESILEVFNNSIVPLVNTLADSTKKFNKFYKNTRFVVQIRGGDSNYHSETFSIGELKKQINSSITFAKILFGYNHLIEVNTIEDFSYNSVIEIEFHLEFYVVKGTFDKTIQKNYSEHLSEDEIKFINSSISKKHKEAIEVVLNNIQRTLH